MRFNSAHADSLGKSRTNLFYLYGMITETNGKVYLLQNGKGET